MTDSRPAASAEADHIMGEALAKAAILRTETVTLQAPDARKVLAAIRSTPTPTYDDDEFLDDDRLIIPQPEFVQRDPMRRPRTPRATATPTPDATDAGSREALRAWVMAAARWDEDSPYTMSLDRHLAALAAPSTPMTEGPQRVDEPYHEWHQRSGVATDDTCYDCNRDARLGKRP